MAKRRRKGKNIAVKKLHRDEDSHEQNNEEKSQPSVLESLVDNVGLVNDDHPLHSMYSQIMSRFNRMEKQKPEEIQPGSELIAGGTETDTDQLAIVSMEPKDGQTKAARKRSRDISLATLKESTSRPDLVEWYDGDAPNPEFLVAIKSVPGVLPVPSNWKIRSEYACFRRESNYRLPPNITETGIADMRNIAQEEIDNVRVRQRTRERVQPRLGRLDQDYTKLRNAFFKSRYRPRLLKYGQLWTDRDTRSSSINYGIFKPGILSDRLRNALGIKANELPPWISIMKELGPSNSYKNVKIPGVNCPANYAVPDPKLPTHWGEFSSQFMDDNVDDVRTTNGSHPSDSHESTPQYETASS